MEYNEPKKHFIYTLLNIQNRTSNAKHHGFGTESMTMPPINELKSIKSNPIQIPKKNLYKTENINENINENNKQTYHLKCSNFNPDKASPPNSWKSRLNVRLERYLS